MLCQKITILCYFLSRICHFVVKFTYLAFFIVTAQPSRFTLWFFLYFQQVGPRFPHIFSDVLECILPKRIVFMLNFNDWWEVEGSWVEPPNTRRGGFSGVIKTVVNGEVVYIKRMENHLYHSLRYPFGLPTIMREVNAIKHLQRSGVVVPEIIFGDAIRKDGQWRALLVTKEMKNFLSLEDWYKTGAYQTIEASVYERILKEIASAFRKMHLQKRQHGSCYPRHIFIHYADHIQAGFIDLEHSRRRLTCAQAKNHDFTQFGKKLAGMPKDDWEKVLNWYEQLA